MCVDGRGGKRELRKKLSEAGKESNDLFEQDILNPSQFLKDAMKKQKFSDGRSGSFFVFSPDNKIILKTIPKEEYDVMQRILPNYYRVQKPKFFT
jgi:hypothetical protein